MLIKFLSWQGRSAIVALLLTGLLSLRPSMAAATEATSLAEIRQAAAQGDAEAQFHLAEMVYRGKIMPRDYKTAASWFKKAAEQGNAEAQNRLGAMYASGQGLGKDPQQAVLWYQKAAEQGVLEAQTNLAFLYANADGDLKDEASAYAWYSLAANHGYANAIQGRDLAAEHLTSEQRIQAIIFAAELQARIDSH